MAERRASMERQTRETDIRISIDLDGAGESAVASGIGFFDHMLTHLARHSLCNLEVSCRGDLEVDAHHTVEDVGICIGKCLAEALGDRSGITRYGSSAVPMDEALVMTALDISGRGSLIYRVDVGKEKVGEFDTELAQEFFKSLCVNAGINAHVRQLEGGNAHHVIEAAFKSFARALREAVRIDPAISGVPSTKGSL